jgi:hypothetical protein
MLAMFSRCVSDYGSAFLSFYLFIVRYNRHIRQKLEASNLLFFYASLSQTLGLKAHHSGCKGIALTPRWTNLNPVSCNLGKAVFTSPPDPDQINSADDAERGQAIESIFDGPDCSAHNSC